MGVVTSELNSGGIRFRACWQNPDVPPTLDVWKKAGWSVLTVEELRDIVKWAKIALGETTHQQESKPAPAAEKTKAEAPALSADDLAKRKAVSTTAPRVMTSIPGAGEADAFDMGKDGVWPGEEPIRFPIGGV